MTRLLPKARSFRSIFLVLVSLERYCLWKRQNCRPIKRIQCHHRPVQKFHALWQMQPWRKAISRGCGDCAKWVSAKQSTGSPRARLITFHLQGRSATRFLLKLPFQMQQKCVSRCSNISRLSFWEFPLCRGTGWKKLKLLASAFTVVKPIEFGEIAGSIKK